MVALPARGSAGGAERARVGDGRDALDRGRARVPHGRARGRVGSGGPQVAPGDPPGGRGARLRPGSVRARGRLRASRRAVARLADAPAAPARAVAPAARGRRGWSRPRGAVVHRASSRRAGVRDPRAGPSARSDALVERGRPRGEWARRAGRARVNLGASGNLDSVLAFKDSLGARMERYPVRWLDAARASASGHALAALQRRARAGRSRGEAS